METDNLNAKESAKFKRINSQHFVNIHLFHCGGTYDLGAVENFLTEAKAKGKISLDIKVVKHDFRVDEISKMRESTIPKLQMDFAIFVVHADDPYLSFNSNQDSPSYGWIYKSLVDNTDDKVLIVIGGDKRYKDEGEKKQFVISHRTRKDISPQFRKELLDGRKSFIFSWDKKHRPIHEEALLHYFDCQKKGYKFKAQAGCRQEINSRRERQPLRKDEGTTPVHEEEGRGRGCRPLNNVVQRRTGAITEGSQNSYPEGTVLLQTRMRYGDISYQDKDVVIWYHQWYPSDRVVRKLKQDWRSTPEAKLQFVAGRFGVNQQITNLTHFWLRPFIYLNDAFWSFINAGTGGAPQ